MPDVLPLVELGVLVAGIIYAAGRVVGAMTATTKQLHDGLEGVNRELGGLRKDVGHLGELAASLQGAITALADRVSWLEERGRTAPEAEPKVIPPTRKHRPVRSRKKKGP
jgi:hypothetical protein